ncbi:MAG: energy-dependent translational throttle protein EttA [Kiritimatiellae bacterium]|jgi:ATP-binding cassette ChvD family protein|nr:energy-dependent translational throttle protein EttA [Kiritimatiellia bacterium]NLD89745.1 energy-dependent translational throttle protein EttA [Lentisphaerota bacterium]HOU20797.1 energy-dependent translational throttle protein EttA [Kiritimatiellia bacterium]HPC19015.1 energy-dependent translational throttle protein EttA [Kiritimatiellia bacterium]HQN80217.1 energy-dependent translational throttle protein EttA [Kiritimatiellia bacterium]
MAGEYVFNLNHLTRQYDSLTVLDDITLAFFFGAKIGVIGGNGAGKSSLLKIIAGLDKDYHGECMVAPGVRVGYLPQEPQLDETKDVAGNVAAGAAAAQAILDRYDELCGRLGEALSDAESEKVNNELGRLQDLIDSRDLWSLDSQIERAMDALRLPPGEAEVRTLSGGEKRRVALCRLLLSNPDALLLDEPTNHLDAETVAWLEEYLKKFSGTLVVVTHDRYFLNNVTEWILEMDAGRGYPFKGNYEKWLEAKQAMAATQTRQNAARQKMLQRELEWIRLNPSGRQSKNKARLSRYEELAAQQVDTREDVLEIQIPSGARLGDLVVRADHVRKVYGQRLIMDKVSFNLPRGGIVGVIGPNGAGKTTLLRMIVGEEQPDGGTLEIGPTVVLSYVNQFRDSLDPCRSVYEEITGGQETLDLGGKPMNGRAYCTRFNFRGADQQKKVGELSGGERNRVHLAKLLRRGGNLLLLDEPTNDLDVTTLRALEEGIQSFGGCAVVVSHDRWFLDRIATHILAFEDDGTVTWFEGNFEGYHEQRRRRLGEAADQPRRIRFRPI